MQAQLSEAALRVMARSGPEGVTVDAIIAEAGVSRGTFYKYHDSPAALIRAVGAEIGDDLIRAVGPQIVAIADPALRLATGFRLILQLARENPLLALFLIRAGWPATDHVPAFSQNVVTNLAAGIATGRFPLVTLAMAQAFVGGATIGMLAAQTEADGGPVEDAAAALSLLLALGIERAEAQEVSARPLAPIAGPAGLAGRAVATAGLTKS
jgi:AcrR family transcriptional regulator